MPDDSITRVKATDRLELSMTGQLNVVCSDAEMSSQMGGIMNNAVSRQLGFQATNFQGGSDPMAMWRGLDAATEAISNYK